MPSTRNPALLVVSRPIDANAPLLPSQQRPCWVTLTKAMLNAIPHLRAGAPVDVRPPRRRGGQWLLDTSGLAPRRLPKTARAARFRIDMLSAEHFLNVGNTFVPHGEDSGRVGAREAITFELGSEIMMSVTLADAAGRPVTGEVGTGFYRLLPTKLISGISLAGQAKARSGRTLPHSAVAAMPSQPALVFKPRPS